MDRDSIQNILSIPTIKRASEQQQLVELASFKDSGLLTTRPPFVSGLYAWYEITSLVENRPKHEEPISLWQDQGPHGFDLKTSTSETTEPHFSKSGFVGGPSLKYSLRSDELKTEQNFGLQGDPNYTVFLAAEFHVEDPQTPASQIAFLFGTDKGAGTIQFLEIDSNAVKHRLDIGSAFGQDATTTTLPQNVPVIISVRKQANQPISTTLITINGHPQEVSGSTAGLNILDGPLFLGYGGTKFTPAMNVAELIVYDRSLNEDEEKTIGQYLAQKYKLETNFSSGSNSSIVQLITTPSQERTDEQTNALSQYFLKYHDSVYRDATLHLSELKTKLYNLSELNKTFPVMAPQEQEQPADLRFFVVVITIHQVNMLLVDSYKLSKAKTTHPFKPRAAVGWNWHVGSQKRPSPYLASDRQSTLERTFWQRDRSD